MNPKVTFILPTRDRYAVLSKSVQSLLDTAAGDAFEVLLGLDSDDEATLRSLEKGPIASCKTFVFPHWGYRNLHLYVNELCARAAGEWLFLWNDDALMQTKGWDRVIDGYSGQFLLLNPNSNHDNHGSNSCVFPIIPRSWFETAGHFSLSNHNDTWVEVVAKHLGILQHVPIHILHDRVDLTGGNDDQTAKDREFTTGEFFGPKVQGQILEDVHKLHASCLRPVRESEGATL